MVIIMVLFCQFNYRYDLRLNFIFFDMKTLKIINRKEVKKKTNPMQMTFK